MTIAWWRNKTSLTQLWTGPKLVDSYCDPKHHVQDHNDQGHCQGLCDDVLPSCQLPLVSQAVHVAHEPELKPESEEDKKAHGEH